MKIESYPIQLFETGKPSEKSILAIPEGANFLEVKVLPDGIHAFYEIPEVVTDNRRTDVFFLLSSGQSIPENSEFVTILDTLIETPKGQAIVIFPIYKQK